MLLIPSIRFRAGHVLGDDGQQTGEVPAELIARLMDHGIRRVQLVDEDSMQSQKPGVLTIVEQLMSRFEDLELQVVSGVNDEELVQSHLDAGANWLVLGHRVASTPHVLKDLCLEFPGHILMQMNVRDGRLAGDAHSKLANHDIVSLARHFEDDGVDGLVYQDVDAEGRPLPPRPDKLAELAEAVRIDVFVAGRIDSMPELEAACRLADAGIAGMILGGSARHINLGEARRMIEAAG